MVVRPKWICGCVVEVGVRLCGRGGRVGVQMKWSCHCVVEMGVWSFSEMVHLGGNVNGRSLQEVKHPVTESLGWEKTLHS